MGLSAYPRAKQPNGTVACQESRGRLKGFRAGRSARPTHDSILTCPDGVSLTHRLQPLSRGAIRNGSLIIWDSPDADSTWISQDVPKLMGRELCAPYETNQGEYLVVARLLSRKGGIAYGTRVLGRRVPIVAVDLPRQGEIPIHRGPRESLSGGQGEGASLEGGTEPALIRFPESAGRMLAMPERPRRYARCGRPRRF